MLTQRVRRLEPGWSYGGLSGEAAAIALAKHGPNVPVTERPLAALVMLCSAIVNPFNMLLTALACVSIGTKDVATFSVMMAMVVLSTSVRYWASISLRLFSLVMLLRLAGTGRR